MRMLGMSRIIRYRVTDLPWPMNSCVVQLGILEILTFLISWHNRCGIIT